MDLDIERHERITAPVLLVWEEMDSLDQILAKTPQALTYDVGPGGQRGTFTANLAWGPLKWAVAGEITVHDAVPLEQLRYVLAASSLSLHYDATIRLTMVGANETRLDYRGHLDLQHRLAHRMRGLFSELIEEHAYGFVNRVKVKAEQRRLAQERLLEVSATGSSPVALVTSGLVGLGAEIVGSLDKAGFRVAVGEKPRPEGDDSVGPPGAASVHHGSLAAPADCERVVKEVVGAHGRLDALVCVAIRRGLSLEIPLERYDTAEWDRALASYLSGPFHLIRAAVAQMLDQGYGRIVAVVPVDGGPGSVGQGVTAVTTSGLIALTQRLAREVAARGVTANVVMAGLVADNWVLDDMPGSLEASVKEVVPAGRLATAAEVARAVSFLCSPDSGYVTGQVVAVDGGLRA